MKSNSKRVFSTVLVIILVMVFAAVPASAAKNVEKVSFEVSSKAYMDVERAPASMKDEILEARREIIYNNSWSAPGEELFAFSFDVQETIKTGEFADIEITEKLPDFYDLFPADWDIPSEEPIV